MAPRLDDPAEFAIIKRMYFPEPDQKEIKVYKKQIKQAR